MLESIALLDKLPDITLITVTINTLKEGLSIDLTDELRNSIPEVVGKVKEVLKDIGSL
jgi:hypothetical protein